LGSASRWGGDWVFIWLLFLTASTGLLLWTMGGTSLMPVMLAVHLGCVLTLFLMMPYSKMVHGFFRLAALTRDAQTNGS
jgi:citrate/tricarballylate utilization protein